nr:universal stress protein [Natronococcus sp. AD5]
MLGYAENWGVDHIVMGNRGRSGIQKMMLGSVAESVVIGSPIPVTIVPDGQNNVA